MGAGAEAAVIATLLAISDFAGSGLSGGVRVYIYFFSLILSAFDLILKENFIECKCSVVTWAFLLAAHLCPFLRRLALLAPVGWRDRHVERAGGRAHPPPSSSPGGRPHPLPTGDAAGAPRPFNRRLTGNWTGMIV